MKTCRFAPSPSGSGVHLGSIRSCFFSYLVAKQTNGRFILRIEDSNQALYSKESEENIYESLRWLGLNWDNEVVLRQSERFEEYKRVAHELVDKGLAYKCVCSPERLESLREDAKAEGKPAVYDGHCDGKSNLEGPYVIRFRVPKYGSTVVKDMVLGRLHCLNVNIGDFILLRPNGEATYILANTYDDIVQGITTIYRGNDGASGNVFKQVLLREALSPGNPAEWGHGAMVLGEDGLKLSKSKGSALVTDYRAMGILPDALLNYLFRLGASAGNKEIFSREEMIALFNPKNISKSDARFDMTKLLSVNKHYIKTTDPEKLANLLRPFLEKELNDSNVPTTPNIIQVIQSLQTRATTLKDMAEKAKFYYQDDFVPERGLSAEEKLWLSSMVDDVDNGAAPEVALECACKDHKITIQQLGPAIRMALSGKSSAPSVIEIMQVLGVEEVVRRIKRAINPES